MSATIFDGTECKLGEGPLWHPERQEFFWFDIGAHRLYARAGDDRRMWQFDGHVSAAGWIDRDRLLVAHERALLVFDIETGESEHLCDLEADNPGTRSNDGRADPWGGFWIGTMSKTLERGAGSFYRYYKGELRQLYSNITVTNAQCFSPDGRYAYFADTPTGKVMRQRLDDINGWPKGPPELFLDLPADQFRPDGAVIDAEGNFWCAHYGHGKVTCHSAKGELMQTHPIPARQSTCPVFVGPNLDRMLVTSAWQNLSDDQRAADRAAGKTFEIAPGVTGQAEHRVEL